MSIVCVIYDSIFSFKSDIHSWTSADSQKLGILRDANDSNVLQISPFPSPDE